MAPIPQLQRAREIFEAAMDLDSAAARVAYARQACAGDTQLLESVLDLLRSG